jgi:hypothetical protein
VTASHRLTLPHAVRRTFLPFPFAVALSFSLIELVDHISRPDRTRIEPTAGAPAVDAIGTCVFVVLTVLLQALWGVPTLLWLERERRRLRTYAAVGAGSAILLSLGFALMLRAPQFGETLSWMLSRTLLLFGAPVVLGYLLAHALMTEELRRA